MLSKKIEINFSELFKKNKPNLVKESTSEERRRSAIDVVDFQTKAKGFAIGFIITFALGVFLLSIGFVII